MNRGGLEALWVGGWAKRVRGIREDTWDHHWVSHVGGESLDSAPEVIALYTDLDVIEQK